MNININLDIAGIISNAVSAERIQPIIDKAISSAISSAIDDATGYRSEFRDALKKQLAEAMPGGLHISDVAKIQHVMNAAVSSAVQSENSALIKAAMTKGLEAIMPNIPEKIKLSDLVKAARESFRIEDNESFYAKFERDGSFGHLYLDEDPDCSGEYRAKFNINFNKEGEAYSLKIDDEFVTHKSLPTVITKFEGFMMALYTGRTTIEVDIDSDDVESLAADQTDY